MAVVDYWIEVMFIIILILKAIDQKAFLLSPVYKHLENTFAYASNKNGPQVKKTNKVQAAFLQNLFKEWMKNSCITKKGKRKNSN